MVDDNHLLDLDDLSFLEEPDDDSLRLHSLPQQTNSIEEKNPLKDERQNIVQRITHAEAPPCRPQEEPKIDSEPGNHNSNVAGRCAELEGEHSSRKRPRPTNSPPAQVRTHSHERRRIPGPAGRLNSASTNENQNGKDFKAKWSKYRRPIASENGDPDFVCASWRAMCMQLGLESPKPERPYQPKGAYFEFNISYVLQKGFQRRIPYLIALIKQFVTCSQSAFVTFKDPYGEIQGTIHEKVLAEYPKIGTGCVIIVKKISVFNPSRLSKYLNVTLENMVHVFPAGRRPGRRRPTSLHKFTSNVQSGHLRQVCETDEKLQEKSRLVHDDDAKEFFLARSEPSHPTATEYHKPVFQSNQSQMQQQKVPSIKSSKVPEYGAAKHLRTLPSSVVSAAPNRTQEKSSNADVLVSEVDDLLADLDENQFDFEL
mmetsp:Transcript_9573/g.23559  ORF Transcript_9573/g.23559 Transcript_9573/m.23559 type:complete len:427 (+) Transcript_9573:3-1283(+)